MHAGYVHRVEINKEGKYIVTVSKWAFVFSSLNEIMDVTDVDEDFIKQIKRNERNIKVSRIIGSSDDSEEEIIIYDKK